MTTDALVRPADAAAIHEAVARHATCETTAWSRDPGETLRAHVGPLLGPTRERGGPAGLVTVRGEVVAEWGDVERVDMSLSIAKSYLALVAGTAFGDGLLVPDEPVARSVLPGLFGSPPHDTITWEHLLTQTSGWRGRLFGRTDEEAALPGAAPAARPGEVFAYNDVRVNLLAYALLRLLGRPLPEVLRDRIMSPIGAPDGWEWHGYDTSYVEVGGRPVQSVCGGGHWGGGLWTSARQDAAVGQLLLGDGMWRGRHIISPLWVERMTRPSTVEPRYGYLWWLNAGGRVYPTVPHDSFMANGGQVNVLWVWPRGATVVVARWLDTDAIEPFLGGVARAVGHA